MKTTNNTRNSHKVVQRIALVTGANRGIGFEVCRQLGLAKFKVYLAARDKSKGSKAAKSLCDEGLDVEFIKLDVNSPKEIDTVVAKLIKKHRNIDVLVNNAGVFLDKAGKGDAYPSVFQTKVKTIEETFSTNTVGPLILCQAVVPHMEKAGYGRIVNVSSGMGQLSEMNGGYPGYRLSKVALNAVTRIFADEIKCDDVKINSVCPGWVRTDMGGKNADLTVQEGADTIVWLCQVGVDGPSGKFFRERKEISW